MLRGALVTVVAIALSSFWLQTVDALPLSNRGPQEPSLVSDTLAVAALPADLRPSLGRPGGRAGEPRSTTHGAPLYALLAAAVFLNPAARRTLVPTLASSSLAQNRAHQVPQRAPPQARLSTS